MKYCWITKGAYAPDESNQGGGAYAPYKYAPDEIRNSMFLPLMKKALMGVIEGRHQNEFIFSYNKIFCPLLYAMSPSPL